MTRMTLAVTLLSLAGGHAALAGVQPPSPAVQRTVLPFISDDYARALADARAQNRPLFADAWASW